MTNPRLTPSAEEDRPDFVSAAVRAQSPALTLVRDVAAGYFAVRDAGQTYLPQHPKEENANYQIRLKRPAFFNALRRTIDGLVGMVFRTSPELGKDVPKPIVQDWENLDKEETHGDVFLKTLLADAMEAGHCAILVDYPRVANPNKRTLADDRAQDIRPYWVHIRKEDILNFRTSRGPGGEQILEQVTLRFASHEPKGTFGDKQVVRYRVYRRTPEGIVWEIWESLQDNSKPSLTQFGTIAKVDRIPLVGVYGRKTGYLQSVPPLLDLACVNLLHYQTNSDYFHALHIGLVPILTLTGVEAGTVAVGPNALLALPQGATATYTETSGAAFGSAVEALQELKGQMAVMGLSLLQPETRAAETAEAKRLDKSEKDSALSTIARALQDAVESALAFHAQLRGLPDGGSISINSDFSGATLNAQQVQTLSDIEAKGQLSLETMWAKLQEGEWLPDDFDPKVERQRLEDAGALPTAPPTTETMTAPGGAQPEVIRQGNPYRVVRHGNQVCVERSDTGERKKCYPAAEKEQALAYFRALEANAKDA